MVRPCRTCRSRKKACNGARPQCGTCLKSGRLCGYEPHVKGVFVNLDAGRMNVRMKSLIGDAIDMAKDEKSETEFHNNQLPGANVGIALPTSPDIHALELSPGEFHSHFQALMTRFRADYARTSSCWSEGVMSIGLRSRVLDMALISLMTIRLSFTSDREQYLLFSLSTYNTGLQSFRRLLQGSASDSTPELVVISLIFTLFEASQQQPTRIYSSGWAGHLAGALTLLQRQGPARFQIDGYHAAFKKLREMTILFVLSKQECTFLAEPEWMEVPWDVINKTRRDYLLDIAMQITTIYALLHSDPSPDDYLGIQTQHRQLLDDLHSWRQSWLEAEAPGIHNPCQGCLNEPCLCLPAITKTVTNEFSFLAAEYTAIAILLNHITLHYLYDSATITDLELTSSALRIALLRTNLQSILTLPCFGHALSDTPGLTEGRCRALFPIWVLSETAPVFTPQRTLDWDWWDGLYDRANHGIA